ncbi:hypothetical protein OAU36_02230 [Gammaproteobacteria bacterium]|nr:hypothetical protein [Gammaproteobacteria bacterium]
MSKKKAKKNSMQGTYALSMSSGLILGFGLGAIMDSVLVATISGGLIGGVAGYLTNHPKTKRKT